MVGQHDAACSYADARSSGGYVPDDNRGCRAGDARHAVMFRQPIPLVAEAFSLPRQLQGVAQRLGRGATLGNGGEVKNREWDHVRSPMAGLSMLVANWRQSRV